MQFGIGAGNFPGWPPREFGVTNGDSPGELTWNHKTAGGWQPASRRSSRLAVSRGPLGNLGKYAGKLAHREGAIAGFDLPPCVADQLLRPK